MVLNIGRPRLQSMQLRDAQSLGCQIDTHHLGPFARHGVRQNASATAHIQHTLVRQWRLGVDPVQSQRVDLMQWLEFTLGIPPAMGQAGEFFQFCRVGIDSVAHDAIVRDYRNGSGIKKAPLPGLFV